MIVIEAEPSKHDSPVFKVSQQLPSQAGCIAIAQELELHPLRNTPKLYFPDPLLSHKSAPEPKAHKQQRNHMTNTTASVGAVDWLLRTVWFQNNVRVPANNVWLPLGIMCGVGFFVCGRGFLCGKQAVDIP